MPLYLASHMTSCCLPNYLALPLALLHIIAKSKFPQLSAVKVSTVKHRFHTVMINTPGFANY